LAQTPLAALLGKNARDPVKYLLLLLLLSLPAGQGAGAAVINFSTASDSGNTAPLWIASDLGFFEKYGNTVRLIFIPGATVSISALINNDVQLAQFSPMLAIANNVKGIDLAITMSLNQFMDNNVFGRKGLTSIKQVKSLAIGRFGSSSDFMGRYLLQREGLKPETDIALLQLGTQTTRVLAVEAGRADSAIVTPPITLMARKKGFSLLIDASRLKIPYTSAVIVTRKSFIQGQRPVVVNFMKGLIEAICYYKTHKEESFKVMSKYLRLQDRDVLEENFRAYDHSLRPYATNELLELPIQEVGKSDPNVIKADPAQFVDHSILKELESTGFIDRVAAQYGLK
jgi:ABC-type nitrate/sulfonate/bicarbonate transport system substrate-binding protein